VGTDVLARFTDRLGRRIAIYVYDPSWYSALLEMYRTFDPSQQAQGIPPLHPLRMERWLQTLLEEGINVVAACDGRVVGHAVLVPDRADAYELAIFVHQDFQGAGIGSRLLRALLELGRQRGVREVWLSVETWNHRALSLYRNAGFRKVEGDQWEQIWKLELHAPTG